MAWRKFPSEQTTETKAERLRRQKREHMRRKRLIEWQRRKGRRAGNIRLGWWAYYD